MSKTIVAPIPAILGAVVYGFLRRISKLTATTFCRNLTYKFSFCERSNFRGSSHTTFYSQKYDFLIKKNLPTFPTAHPELRPWKLNERLLNSISLPTGRSIGRRSGSNSLSLSTQSQGGVQISRKLVVPPTDLSSDLWTRFLSKNSRSSFLGTGALLFLFFILVGNHTRLAAQDSSLWTDKNPYSIRQSIKVGSPIYVKIRNGLQAEFELESNADETLTLKSMPDKKIISDMPSYNNDRTITRKNKGKIKSLGKVKGNLTALVTAVDPNTGLLSIQGQKANLINGEENSLLLSGTVSPEFVEKDSSIDADKIANLRVDFNGRIKPRQTTPPIVLKTVTNPDGSVTTKAELSEEEKQRLILNHLNRLLGESQ
nr:flagellar basal body L-ring protein FlgH [Leptospira alstonii]